MAADDPFEACAAAVRAADPDRYFSALFAPERPRRHLFALYAFNNELARIGETVREPMMGEIRLEWWREALDGARAGRPRSHDVARALAGAFAAADLPAPPFAQMIDARAFDFTPGAFADGRSRDAYLDATSANLMRLASRVLGAGDRHDDLAREAGIAYGLAGLLRNGAARATRGKAFLRAGAAEQKAVADARERLAKARALPRPGLALAAFMPATLVPLYLRDPARAIALPRRQIALLGAALRGRV